MYVILLMIGVPLICGVLVGVLHFCYLERKISGVKCKVGCILLFCFWGFGADTNKETTEHLSQTEQTIVSTRSFDGGNGSLSGAFGIVSGTYEGRVYYVLRVREGDVYKDITVRNGAYLKTDNTLTETGLYIEKLIHKEIYLTYNIFGTVIAEDRAIGRKKVYEKVIVLPEDFIELKLNSKL